MYPWSNVKPMVVLELLEDKLWTLENLEMEVTIKWKTISKIHKRAGNPNRYR